MNKKEYDAHIKLENSLSCLTWEELNDVAYPSKIRGFYQIIAGALKLGFCDLRANYEPFIEKSPRYKTLLAREMLSGLSSKV